MQWGVGRLSCWLVAFWMAGAGMMSADASPSSGLADTVAAIKPSIVAVGTTDPIPGTPPNFMGTGFVVGDGNYVVTALHVVTSTPLDIQRRQELAVYSGTGNRFRIQLATIVSRDALHDLVLLHVSGLNLPVLHFGVAEALREGTSLAFTGFPLGYVLGLYPVTHTATLSSITPIVMPVLSSQELTGRQIRQMPTPYPVFQLDATAFPGNSGSPLYEVNSGHVVGLLNLVAVKETKEAVLASLSGVAYAVPGNYIEALLVSAGVTP